MSCNNGCKLCRNIVISTGVTYNETDNQVVVALPAGAYNNMQKCCIIIAQDIPTEATLSSTVVFSIGAGTETYPFVNKCCQNVLASQITSRRIYPTKVSTNVSDGVFRYVGNCKLPCSLLNVQGSLNG